MCSFYSDQTAEYFPGSTSGDIRMVISQICKDKSRKKKQLSEGWLHLRNEKDIPEYRKFSLSSEIEFQQSYE